jgi:heptosyltransferase-2
MAIKRVLFVTLSNIGDAILTLPALDMLRSALPGAEITVVCGRRPAEIFANNPLVGRLIIYDKKAKFSARWKLLQQLRREKFDLCVDLRNSLFGFACGAKYRPPFFLAVPGRIRHMRQRHLFRAARSLPGPAPEGNAARNSLFTRPEEEEGINQLLKESGISAQEKICLLAPGARSHIKRWPQDNFLRLAEMLAKEFSFKIVLAGDKDDIAVCRHIAQGSRVQPLDLSGRTSLAELACLLRRATLAVVNDSAVLHLASYVNTPIAAIFGPTNELKYGPWADKSAVVKKDIFCRPCAKAQCRFGTLACMHIIKPDDVLREIKEIFSSTIHHPPSTIHPIGNFNRILIVRTDRVGDVILSTPIIRALRAAYPDAYIAMMVSPYAAEAVEGNPFLDEAIIYDKDGKHKSWLRSAKFSRRLKKKRFDLALVLHPTNRVHLLTFFAGIKKRIGYNRKLGFLLTGRLEHKKQLGEKHESEYVLDFARYLGIEPEDKSLFMPVKEEARRWRDEFFSAQGIAVRDKLLAVHPGASCPSKLWPAERFAAAADALAEKYGFKVLIIAGPKDVAVADAMQAKMRFTSLNLAGKTSLSQLAAVLERCGLLISNDSGPVHVAAALGTPVVAVFGRSQKGLSPKRWGPLGGKSKVVQKNIGCLECLAHRCEKGFACLEAISVEDVLSAAEEIL